MHIYFFLLLVKLFTLPAVFGLVNKDSQTHLNCMHCCGCRQYADDTFDSDSELATASESAEPRSALSKERAVASVKDHDPLLSTAQVRTSCSAAPTVESSAVDRGRPYCPSSTDSCPQLTSTSSSIHQHPQPYLSCWLSHVAPTDFADGQMRHS